VPESTPVSASKEIPFGRVDCSLPSSSNDDADSSGAGVLSARKVC